ncbi:hypothetical protein CC80DRAFT_574222 [Byssothecium circinans]|uniref:Uncharacterized protein n=1 Tax=Byssothecium circinans TaxID=147558 RepID=A0A6A5U9R0_9PLEO|nr:hypothetical protein CC80DRAFT_574222 [Byssothecium circinans]
MAPYDENHTGAENRTKTDDKPTRKEYQQVEVGVPLLIASFEFDEDGYFIEDEQERALAHQESAQALSEPLRDKEIPPKLVRNNESVGFRDGLLDISDRILELNSSDDENGGGKTDEHKTQLEVPKSEKEDDYEGNKRRSQENR